MRDHNLGDVGTQPSKKISSFNKLKSPHQCVDMRSNVLVGLDRLVSRRNWHKFVWLLRQKCLCETITIRNRQCKQTTKIDSRWSIPRLRVLKRAFPRKTVPYEPNHKPNYYATRISRALMGPSEPLLPGKFVSRGRTAERFRWWAPEWEEEGLVSKPQSVLGFQTTWRMQNDATRKRTMQQWPLCHASRFDDEVFWDVQNWDPRSRLLNNEWFATGELETSIPIDLNRSHLADDLFCRLDVHLDCRPGAGINWKKREGWVFRFLSLSFLE